MAEKYYQFEDAHPTGGIAKVMITEAQILEHMRQFTDYKGLTDEQLVVKFTQDRNATHMPTPRCSPKSWSAIKNKLKSEVPKVCSRDDKCCKHPPTEGFVPNRKGAEL